MNKACHVGFPPIEARPYPITMCGGDEVPFGHTYVHWTTRELVTCPQCLAEISTLEPFSKVMIQA